MRAPPVCRCDDDLALGVFRNQSNADLGPTYFSCLPSSVFARAITFLTLDRALTVVALGCWLARPFKFLPVIAVT
jgi:hypothetical protein